MTCIILEVDTMPTGSCFETIAVSNNKAFHSNNSNSLQSAAVSDTSSRLISQRNGLNLILYGNNYNGFPVIIVESNKIDGNIGKLHPLKIGKSTHNIFTGILLISPIGHRVKLSFDSINSANNRLCSPLLHDTDICAGISSTLIYSYGIIRLDTSIPETDFWDG